MSAWVEGEIVRKTRWTDRLFSLEVAAPVEDYRAGQFTKLALDIDGERVARPYSYVNPPQRRPLEFYFITVADGPLSTRMETLDAGDKVWVQSRATGMFTLSEIRDARNLWLLSTGTALGVFLAILNTDEPWSRFENVILVHGVRTAEELTYRAAIENIQAQHPDQFRMISVVSREQTDGALHGRVTHAIEDGRLEESAGATLAPETSQVMICGNNDMVRDTAALLEARGMQRNRRREPGHYTLEKYY